MSFVCVNSFPKSGNTWLRYILSHLLFDGSLESVPDKYRSSIFAAPSISCRGAELRFYKSHDRVLLGQFGEKKIAHEFCLYIHRHPLDVFLSQLNHLFRSQALKNRLLRSEAWAWVHGARSVEDAVASGDIEYFFGVFLIYGTLQPHFPAAGSWQQHAAYWLDPPVKTYRLCYERMVDGDFSVLREILPLLCKDDTQLDAALAAAAQDTKIDNGFFWKQKPGLWKEYVPRKCAQRFFEINGKLVKRLGYQGGMD